MRKTMLTLSTIALTGMLATVALPQTSTSPTGPAFSWRFFTTALDKDPTRDVALVMQLPLPTRQGKAFHTPHRAHGDLVGEDERTFTVHCPPPPPLQPSDFCYF